MDKISQAQEKFSLLDSVPLGVCVLQSDQVVLFWNSCLEEWTKIPRRQVIGTCIGEHFPHFNQPQYANRLQQIYQGGPPTIFSSQLHKYIIPSPLPQGKYRIQHTTVTSVPALDGVGFYAVLSIQDVTDLTYRVQEYRNMRDRALAEAEERRRAQEAAEAANRVKDEFLAIVSHELRTPLNPILGWSKLLKAGKLDEVTTVRAINIIERNAKQQVQLIDDLLDVSGILRGKLKLNFETVDLALIINGACETVRLAAEAKSIEIILKLDAEVGEVKGDSNRLQQIFCNLLSNAIKFTPAEGRVEVSLSTVCGQEKQTDNKSYAQIAVSDTGQGISPEFLPYVFEYFRQADSSSTRSAGGLGLGLAIVRNLTQLHGGTITAESPGEGQGATFTVRLPLVEKSRKAILHRYKRGEINQNSCLKGVKILVVDDDLDTLEVIALILEEQGANVTLAGSAKEAIATIANFQPDVLVSDLGMPDIDGYDFIRQLRTHSPEQGGQIPAIALTAYAAEATQHEVLTAGFQKYIAKPAEPTELVAAIAELFMYSNCAHQPDGA